MTEPFAALRLRATYSAAATCYLQRCGYAATYSAAAGLKNRQARRPVLLFRLAERPLHHVVRIGGDRAVAPQPSHHLRQDGSAVFLTVQIHAPCVVHVVTLLRESLHQPDILEEPVALLVVGAAASDAAIVVAAVAQEYANG